MDLHTVEARNLDRVLGGGGVVASRLLDLLNGHCEGVRGELFRQLQPTEANKSRTSGTRTRTGHSGRLLDFLDDNCKDFGDNAMMECGDGFRRIKALGWRGLVLHVLNGHCEAVQLCHGSVRLAHPT